MLRTECLESSTVLSNSSFFFYISCLYLYEGAINHHSFETSVCLLYCVCNWGICDVTGPVKVSELSRSKRSGRTVIPPLAWWASQRVFIDPFTHKLEIVSGSVNGIMEYNQVVHFSSERTGNHAKSVIFCLAH
jgi:hypothetical protein